jgi:predicted nucleic acid-binding protein
VGLVLLRGEAVVPKRRITICRDPKDNMFLEAAADGNADIIISGDDDLLDLGAFEGVPVSTPSESLAELERTLLFSGLILFIIRIRRRKHRRDIAIL